MASTNKIKRQLSKLSDEELKEVFEFFEDEDVKVEVTKEEPKEEVTPQKEEPKETPKKEETPKQEEPKDNPYDEMFTKLLSQFESKLEQFATKEEIKAIAKEIPKTEDWGVKGTPSSTDEEYEYDNPNDIVAKLNSTDY